MMYFEVLDAVILMALLKFFGDDEGEIQTAMYISGGAAVLAWTLRFGLENTLGAGAIVVAGVVTAVALAISLSAIMSLPIKRSLIIAGIFLAVHTIVGLAVDALISA